jgi:hypothetical protein
VVDAPKVTAEEVALLKERFPMAMTRKQNTLTRPESGLVAAIADAHAAAERAARVAADANVWARRANTASDDAMEASAAAIRARSAAQNAERATHVEVAWQWARLAWAAETSAEEASDRVNAAIAETLAAA